MKCTDITHQWGYNQHGKWVEQYRSADGLLLLENHPPVNQYSRTPVADVAAERGWCKPVVEQPVESVIEPVDQPQLSFGMGTLVLLGILSFAAAEGIKYWKRKQEEQLVYEPKYLNPWEGEQPHPSAGGYMRNPYEPERCGLHDWSAPPTAPLTCTPPHPQQSISAPPEQYVAPISAPPEQYAAPISAPYQVTSAPHVENTAPIGALHGENTAPISAPNKTVRLPTGVTDTGLEDLVNRFSDNYCKHLSPDGVTWGEYYLPELNEFIQRRLPFDPLKSEDPLEYASFKEVKRISELNKEKVILVVWAEKKSGSSKSYQAAQIRYEEFLKR